MHHDHEITYFTSKICRGFPKTDDHQCDIFHIAVALPARAERTLLNFLCTCLTCAFFACLTARGHAMNVQLHSTFLVCPARLFFHVIKIDCSMHPRGKSDRNGKWPLQVLYTKLWCTFSAKITAYFVST